MNVGSSIVELPNPLTISHYIITIYLYKLTMNFRGLNILSNRKPNDRTHFTVRGLRNYLKNFKQSLTHVNTMQTGCNCTSGKTMNLRKDYALSRSATLALRRQLSEVVLTFRTRLVDPLPTPTHFTE